MEVSTLIEAHKFEDLETDIKTLVDEINSDESEAAIQGLLHLVSEANLCFEALRDTYTQWRSGSKISPQAKVRFSRHVELFHRLLTKASRTLSRFGYSIECPPFPHTPLPAVHAIRPEFEASTSLDELSSTRPTAEANTNFRGGGEKIVVEQVTASERTKEINDQDAMDNLSVPVEGHTPTRLSTSNAPPPTSNSPRHFIFPDVQTIGDTTRKCTVALMNLPSPLTTAPEVERRAKEAQLDAGEEQQRVRSASRLAEEERLKTETDKRVEEEEREELELLKRVAEVRQRKERLAQLAEERLERVKREERDLMENLQAQNSIIRLELQQERLSPLLTPGRANEADKEVEGFCNVDSGRLNIAEGSKSAFRPISAKSGENADERGRESNTPTLARLKALRCPEILRLPFPPSPSVQVTGETKPDIKLLIDEITTAFKTQNEMMAQLTKSHLQLQNEMKDLKSSNQPPKFRAKPPPTPPRPTNSPGATLDTLLAHSRLPEGRWKGGRDVRSFLKKFKTLVEDLPGITADMVWNEIPYRTAGLALLLSEPYKDEEAHVALQKTKDRYLSIWARTSRDVREILEEVVKGSQVKANDFNALISLIAELEDYRRQAALNGDEGRFDEADSLMAIVASRLTCFELKWSKHALKQRNKGEIVNFQTLLTFIEDEAAALEEPEGAKARARAHEFVGQIQRQATNKKIPERDKWGGRGSKSEPLIVNAVQVANAQSPSNQTLSRSQQPTSVVNSSGVTSSPFTSSSSLSSHASPFVPTPHAQFLDRGRERRGCVACRGPHSFYTCNQFLSMDAAARRPFTARHRVCFKCANSVSHGWRQCTQQSLKCFWCHSVNHHSTLHVDNDASPEPFTDARLAGGPYMMGTSASSAITPPTALTSNSS